MLQRCLYNKNKQPIDLCSIVVVSFKAKLPETAGAEPDRGRGVRSFFVCHTLRAPEMFEQEVEIILSGLEGQLMQ